jgi:hypothetical protein
VRTRIRRSIVAAFAVAAALSLAACGTPPWADPSLQPHSSHSASAKHTSAPTHTPVVNDLAGGSVTHTLGSGTVTLQVKYYSDLPIDQWTASASKPLNISATATIANDAGQSVYLSKLTVTPVVKSPTEDLKSPMPFVDSATVSPGYLIKSPYSYTQTYTLPALDSRARSVTLDFDYEMLLQSTPTSGSYAKQSVSDAFTVAILPG